MNMTDSTPKRITLTPEAFDHLQQRLAAPGRYCPRIARVLSRTAPWEHDCDKTSTSANHWLPHWAIPTPQEP